MNSKELTPEQVKNAIEKHLHFHGRTNDKWWLQASVKNYLEGGYVSGSFLEAIRKIIEDCTALDAGREEELQTGQTQSQQPNDHIGEANEMVSATPSAVSEEELRKEVDKFYTQEYGSPPSKDNFAVPTLIAFGKYLATRSRLPSTH